MQRQCFKVLDRFIELTESDMQRQRQKVVAQHYLIGQTNPLDVNVEGDTCYNNRLFNTDTATFQARIIVTTTFCEYNTQSKKMVMTVYGPNVWHRTND